MPHEDHGIDDTNPGAPESVDDRSEKEMINTVTGYDGTGDARLDILESLDISMEKGVSDKVNEKNGTD